MSKREFRKGGRVGWDELHIGTACAKGLGWEGAKFTLGTEMRQAWLEYREQGKD